MRFYTVDVKSITSSLPRSNFIESDLDRLAELILESEGLIRPLILKQTGIEEYTVVAGHLEYYAAVRAKEKNSRKGEMVNAFVIAPKSDMVIEKQVELIKEMIDTSSSDSGVGNLSRLTNIELRFEQRMNELQSALLDQSKQFSEEIKAVETRIPKQVKPLELFNTLEEENLVLKLKVSRIKNADKLAGNIILARNNQPNKQFDNYQSIIEGIKGLGAKTLITIIDEWSKG